MGQVEQVLVVRVGVHRGHEATHDVEGLVDHFDHGHEAVGRARGVRDHDVTLGVVVAVVDAHDEGGVGVARRGRDDDPLHRAAEVRRRVGPAGEAAGGFDHDVCPELVPGHLLGLTLGHDPDHLVADDQVAPLDLDRHRQPPVRRVVTKQVRQGLRRRQVVDAHHVHVGPGDQDGPQEVAPDAPEPVHSDSHGHVVVLPLSFVPLGHRSRCAGPVGRIDCSIPVIVPCCSIPAAADSPIPAAVLRRDAGARACHAKSSVNGSPTPVARTPVPVISAPMPADRRAPAPVWPGCGRECCHPSTGD